MLLKNHLVVLHFNFQSLDWLRFLNTILPLPNPIFVAFTPQQLQRLGGIQLVAQVFRHWKQQPHWEQVYLHLDHAQTVDICTQAVKLGFDSVMFDGSNLPFETNCLLTQKVAKLAHSQGVLVEAELGRLNPTNYLKTQPHEVQQFMLQTKVDFLAVAVGNYHGLRQQPAVIDWELLKRIRFITPLGITLHGASGLPTQLLEQLVQQNLIQKINFDTDLQKAFLTAWPRLSQIDYFAYYNTAMQSVMKLIQFWTAKFPRKT